MEIKDLRRPPKELVEGFRSVGTSTLGDILDGMGLEGVISGLRPMKGGTVLVWSCTHRQTGLRGLGDLRY